MNSQILEPELVEKAAKKKTAKSKVDQPDVFTIGHSTRTKEEFLDILKIYGVTRLVDIRTIPKSRHNPQFNQDVFSEYLRNAGIAYNHIKGLGGLRHATKDSVNTAWRNSSFRGFADYMQTKQFSDSVDELIALISRETKNGGKVAYMCAEALPWRCHRSLVSDALTIRNFHVAHILSLRSAQTHKITTFAKVRGKKVTYPGNE